ncbi:MAG: SAM-dependent chlorinase/fluorinase [Bacteroidales bacterium]|nr:SAM-dependent chlorinase/fluorinase [Bacteroidales bacterium]
MSIVTLTTDWAKDDYYIGAVKGSLYSNCDDVTVVDISHKVKPFNTFQAAFILKHCFSYYPKGTVHIIGVNADKTEKQNYVIAEFNKSFFIGTDNGIFSLLFKTKDDVNYYKIDKIKPSTFPVLDIFCRVACKLVKGNRINTFASPIKSIERKVPLRATIEDNVITGGIVYIDSYQNAITNVSKDIFARVGLGKPFKIYVQSNHHVISKINTSYQETSVGELLAIFNSLGLLEIAINGGNAAELLNLDTSSSVRIRFS